MRRHVIKILVAIIALLCSTRLLSIEGSFISWQVYADSQLVGHTTELSEWTEFVPDQDEKLIILRSTFDIPEFARPQSLTLPLTWNNIGVRINDRVLAIASPYIKGDIFKRWYLEVPSGQTSEVEISFYNLGPSFNFQHEKLRLSNINSTLVSIERFLLNDIHILFLGQMIFSPIYLLILSFLIPLLKRRLWLISMASLFFIPFCIMGTDLLDGLAIASQSYLKFQLICQIVSYMCILNFVYLQFKISSIWVNSAKILNFGNIFFAVLILVHLLALAELEFAFFVATSKITAIVIVAVFGSFILFGRARNADKVVLFLGVGLGCSSLISDILNLELYFTGYGISLICAYSSFLPIEAYYKQNLVIKSQEEEISKAEVFKAIAQTTQMLAHDVRKPFSMMEALIEMVGDLKDPQDIQDTLQESLPSVSQAIISVNGMIQDVMEIGAKSAMTVRPVPARKFVKEVLEQLFQYREDLEIALSYDLPSNLYFEIDDIKFSRVFSNIIGNAVEHMKGRGKIWLHADNPIDGRSTFIIGNSNSFIDAADLERLFEAFFTKNKTGGTGLGLAIAKKVIEAHAGTISCRSDPAVGTEFVFTIPAVLKERSASIDLYSRVKDYYREPKQIKRESALEMSAEISRDIAAANLSLAIVDDELIYIATVLRQLKAVSADVDSTSFSTCEALITAIDNKTHPSIVILDVDLGAGHSNGFECCRKLRKIGFTGILCIHSNRGRLVYQPLAIEAGADFFVPKPMSKLDLLNMLSTAATRLTNDHLTVPIQDFSKAVLLFEDERIFQRRWKKVLAPVCVICVDSWQQFRQDYPRFDWSTLSFVIMDLHLAHDENGIDVALNIKKLASDLKIYLSSNAEEVDFPRGLFAAIVGKDPAQALRKIDDDRV